MAKTSFERMLTVLDLFEEGKLEWTIDEMMQALSYSRSTLYRYLKALSNAGFLSTIPTAEYTLGPRIIELDYLLRKSDPLIVNGRPFLLELVERYPGTALLVRLFKDKILCVHYERSSKDTRTSYARGRLMPISKGASGKIILPHLARTHLMRIIESNLDDFKQTSFGQTSSEVYHNLKTIRNQGFALAHGEITPGVYGIAAPVFDANQAVIASLSITVEDRQVEQNQIKEIAENVKLCAAILSKSLTSNHPEDLND